MRATYSVVLKSGLPPSERSFLSALSAMEITQGEGAEPLLEFHCTKIDVSHHTYIEMETFRPDDQVIFPLRIPHFFVLAIHHSERPKKIGFVTPDT